MPINELPIFRIVVDGMYYCGELVNNTYTFNDPFSSNSFHTAPGGKTTLEFSGNYEKAKLIEGRNNLASHVKRVIEFVTCASDMPKEIKIERSPFPIPLTMTGTIISAQSYTCKNRIVKSQIVYERVIVLIEKYINIYLVICETHHKAVDCRNHSDALYNVRKPWLWCDECAKLHEVIRLNEAENTNGKLI